MINLYYLSIFRNTFRKY